MTTRVEAAAPADLRAIRAAYADARAKQRSTNSPLWPEFTDSAILADIDAGKLHCVFDGDAFVGVFTAIYSDPDIWGELERGAHMYLHRIARSASYPGGGLVDAVFAWAIARAEALGLEGLRLDTWASNVALIDYYGKRGFKLVKVQHIALDSPLAVNYRGNSFALLERPLTADLAVALTRMNAAQCGSFGEFVFETVARDTLKVPIQSVHRERVDFLVNGSPVDVKTSLKGLGQPLPPLLGYRGKRVESISYARVEFFSEGARVSLEANEWAVLTWAELRDVSQLWLAGSGLPKARAKRDVSESLRDMRGRIANHLHSLGYRSRIIYRTVQAEFGNESPHNLLPTDARVDRVTVYLDFGDASFSESSLTRVYAFPEIVANELPRVEKTRLHFAKVDLAKMPSQFVFNDLSAFFSGIEAVLRIAARSNS